MENVLGLDTLVREVLTGIPTLVSALHTSYDEILKMTDTVTARRDMRRLELISDAFANLIFEPDGLRHRLRKYLDDPKSRRVTEEIKSSLNRSQELYLDALKQLKLSSSFKARHPELMEQITTYHREKDRLITGIGNRIKIRGTKEELEELRRLEPLFDDVNTGIRAIHQNIRDCLLQLDKSTASSHKNTAGTRHKPHSA
jgi:hypothetical protein